MDTQLARRPRSGGCITENIYHVQIIVVFYLRRCSMNLAPQMTSNSTNLPSSSGKKPLYECSTQFKSWRYSSEQLGQIRQTLNAAAVEAIRKTIEENEVCRHPILLAKFFHMDHLSQARRLL